MNQIGIIFDTDGKENIILRNLFLEGDIPTQIVDTEKRELEDEWETVSTMITLDPNTIMDTLNEKSLACRSAILSTMCLLLSEESMDSMEIAEN